MRTVRVLLIGCLAAATLAACGAEEEPKAGSPTAQTSVTPGSSSATPAPGTSGGGTASPAPSKPGSTTAPQPPRPTEGPELPAGLPDITLVRTGGFAGVMDTWKISPQGTWQVTDRTGKTRSGKLSPELRSQIISLTQNPALGTELAKTGTAKCADGFHYQLTINTRKYEAEDCGEARPTFSKLVTAIQQSTGA
ncbi:hypothetical protein [Longispora albida]|uniref:hypothetical protein n=1 Tax=Longispora albida TaxID=203523 RepID=UPI0003730BE5|nr:hypothetical protein [Longispora albida]